MAKRKQSLPTATIKMPKPSRRDIERRAIIEITELRNKEHSVNIDFRDSQVRTTGSRVFDAIAHMIKGNIEDMCEDLGGALGQRLTKNQQKEDEATKLIIQNKHLKDKLETIRKLTLNINTRAQPQDTAIKQIKQIKSNLINSLT